VNRGEEGVSEVADFRRRLVRAVKDMPRSDREQLLEQINCHLDDALSPTSTAAEVRTVLEALGSPEAIAAAARAEVPGSAATKHRGIDPKQLSWVALGILAAAFTLFLTNFLGALALALDATFLAVALVATAVGRPREAAPLYLLGAAGSLSGILMFESLVEPSLAANGPALAFQWPQSLLLPTLFIAACFLGIRWLRRIGKARVELDKS
jgi:uncharacterized membrane protein